MRLLLALVLIVMPAFAVLADNCGDDANQAELDACAGKAYQKSDAQLNGLYKQIQQRLKDDAAAEKLLTASQRAWVAFRDAECDFSSSGVQGGTIYPMVYTLCRDQLTKKRISDFKAYLNCEEGDTACPVPAQ